MSETVVAKRYANGFLEFAGESIGFDRGLGELIAFKAVLRDNPDLREFMRSPEIAYSEKCSFIDSALSGGFSDELRFLLMLLLKKGRIDEYDNIAEYARIKYAHGDSAEAVLTASYPLDTAQIKNIKSALEKKFEKKMHVYMDLDADLLGGVRAAVGNFIIDGSAKKRLQDVKAKLMALRVD